MPYLAGPHKSDESSSRLRKLDPAVRRASGEPDWVRIDAAMNDAAKHGDKPGMFAVNDE